jgi:hypothetical protein
VATLQGIKGLTNAMQQQAVVSAQCWHWGGHNWLL